MAKTIHIVSFDVPYPPDYGGVMDVYHKARALTELGVKVNLHCYQYGREKAAGLNKVAVKVYYYKRKVYNDPLFGNLPYIVSTRSSFELLRNLLKDEYPVIFEGLHCCYFLDHPSLEGRIKIVRNHNIEHLYYQHLSRVEKNLFKKFFFSTEAKRLKQFEKILKHATHVAAISPNDHRYLENKYGNSILLPVFHPNKGMDILSGKGSYALYHGNLSVGENNESALFLAREVFSKLPAIPFYIAGMNPSTELKYEVKSHDNMKIFSSLSTDEIFTLIQNAQVNIIPTFQSTGIKLKLLNVMFRGRHCVVNSRMIKGTFLEPACEEANTPNEMIKLVQKLMERELSVEEIKRRGEILNTHYSNQRNAEELISMLHY